MRWAGRWTAASALTSLLTFACPIDARADWLFGGYMGASGTNTNTLTVTPTSGPTSTLAGVKYIGQAFESPIYYGARVSWLRHGDGSGTFSPEVEWTHAKAIAEFDPAGQDLTAFQQSHGLNFLLGNLVYRTTPGCGTRCVFVARGGVGISTPHAESTVRGQHQEQYQYGGVAWQAGAGIEFRVWRGIYAVGDARFTGVSEQHLRGAGADIAGTFFTRHLDFGLAMRIGTR